MGRSSQLPPIRLLRQGKGRLRGSPRHDKWSPSYQRKRWSRMKMRMVREKITTKIWAIVTITVLAKRRHPFRGILPRILPRQRPRMISPNSIARDTRIRIHRHRIKVHTMALRPTHTRSHPSGRVRAHTTTRGSLALKITSESSSVRGKGIWTITTTVRTTCTALRRRRVCRISINTHIRRHPTHINMKVRRINCHIGSCTDRV